MQSTTLQILPNRVSRMDLLFLPGDQNSCTNPSDETESPFLGWFGPDQCWENWSWLRSHLDDRAGDLQYALTNNLTWYLNDGPAAHQTNRILVRSGWLRVWNTAARFGAQRQVIWTVRITHWCALALGPISIQTRVCPKSHNRPTHPRTHRENRDEQNTLTIY